MPLLTHEDLDRLREDPCPGCGNIHDDDQPTVFSPKCHPGYPVFVDYLPVGRLISISCAVCAEEVGTLEIV